MKSKSSDGFDCVWKTKIGIVSGWNGQQKLKKYQRLFCTETQEKIF